jgi:hypothetical protein
MYNKYNSASGDCYESVEPSVTGDKTLTFTDTQDAVYVRGGVGSSNKGTLSWNYPAVVNIEVDGEAMVVKNNSILETEVTSIKLDVALTQIAWLQMIGLRNIS